MNFDPDLIDALRPILPIATFILGILVSKLEKWRLERRAVRNIQVMFLLELQENFRMLIMFVPRKDQTDSSIPRVIADHLRPPRTAVYQAYLGRIDQLAPQKVNGLYQAYLYLDRLYADVVTYRKMRDDEVEASVLSNVAAAVSIWAAKSSGVLTETMIEIGGNRKAIAELETQRGARLQRINSATP